VEFTNIHGVLHKIEYILEAKLDKTIYKYIQRFKEDRPKEPPFPKIIFRTMKDKEWEGIKKGKSSGSFWTSDPTEYGFHALGDFGKSSDNVLAAAKFNKSDGKVYRGIIKTKEQAKKAHWQSIVTKKLSDILAVYKWNSSKMEKIYG